MSPLRRWIRIALLSAIPLAAAGVVATLGDQVWPWDAKMIDFGVYRRAATMLLRGQDFYAGSELPFIYPPFAALLVLPSAVGPLWCAQVTWTVISAVLLLAMMRRLGLHGWQLALATAVLITAADPVRSTFYLGQINIIVTALVVLDLAPGWPGLQRRIPRGLLTGVAAAIKLTPALFPVCLWFAGRRREAGTALASFGVCTALGFAVLPQQSLHFWRGLSSGGGSGVHNGVVYFTNQSVIGAWVRWFGHRPDDVGVAALLLAALTLLLTVAVAVLWQRLGEPALALGLCGVGGLLASPIAWDHHFIWAVPLGLVALERHHLPVPVRFAVLGACGWMLAAPYMGLPGDGLRELRFTFAQKTVDSMSAALGLVALTVSLWFGLRASRSARAAPAAPTAQDAVLIPNPGA